MGSETQHMLINLAQQLAGVPGFLRIVAGVLGAALILAGMLRLSNLAQTGLRSAQGEAGVCFSLIIAGVFLVSIFSFIDIMTVSVFGDGWWISTQDVFSYASDSTKKASLYGGYILFSIVVVVLVGIYGIIAGLVMLHRGFMDSRAFWVATTHIIGGVFCVNIVAVLRLTGASTQGPVGDFIKNVLA